jgi:hypothetical protein
MEESNRRSRLLELDMKFWTIVSIREPGVPRPDCLRNAKQTLAVGFVNHPKLLDNRFQQDQERAQRCRAYRLGD